MLSAEISGAGPRRSRPLIYSPSALSDGRLVRAMASMVGAIARSIVFIGGEEEGGEEAAERNEVGTRENLHLHIAVSLELLDRTVGAGEEAEDQRRQQGEADDAELGERL
jgi:hypothetical protein